MSRPRVVVGITGGIAAYKIPHLIRLLRKRGAEVKVVLTSSARPLVGTGTLKTLSGFPVYCDESSTYDMEHISLTRWADLLCIAPATANTIAKMAHGIADNLLTTIVLAFSPDKMVVAPAMNTVMWESSVTQENISRLSERGVKILPVGHGELACGDEGPGRMVEVEQIADAVIHHYTGGKRLSGRKVLISSGPTEEPIDPVRVITNRSSGKMGAALTTIALRMGAEVTVVSGPATAPLPDDATVIGVRTAAEMERELRRYFPDAHICIMAAAVSDYRTETTAPQKIRREQQKQLSVDLIANGDILEGLGKCKTGQMLVGFALEESDDIERAREKMTRKGCDLMVLNSIGKALGKDTTEVTLIDSGGGCIHTGRVDKESAAMAILNRIVELQEADNE